MELRLATAKLGAQAVDWKPDIVKKLNAELYWTDTLKEVRLEALDLRLGNQKSATLMDTPLARGNHA